MDFFYRTEDIKQEEILPYFVETVQDRDVIETLKSRNPVVLEGSRGVGKTFLFRVAEAELLRDLDKCRTFPIYVSFSRSSLIHTSDPLQFQHWMLARICSRVIRTLRRRDLLRVPHSSISIVGGESPAQAKVGKTRVEAMAEEFEISYRQPGKLVDLSGLPSIDSFRDAMEDLASHLNMERFVFFIDEAAHILLPQQQRDFFTLFRDLRSPYVTCNAAVYPGVTSFGESFQPVHDATMLTLDRDISADNYLSEMREIVAKQAAETDIFKNVERNGDSFSVLAYASSGNPRILLKTLARAPRVTGRQVNEVLREYYRTDIWSEHSSLADKYMGHRAFIDWGRRFIEETVLPEIQRKNQVYLDTDRQCSCFFWIHRDAPEPVREALRLLAYTGIVKQHSSGIKATRAEIGTRYMVNLGCLFSLESTPTTAASQIARSLTPKRMSEFGANHIEYQSLIDAVPTHTETAPSDVLRDQLNKSIDVLDITAYQKHQLHKLQLSTIGDVLSATETKLQEAHYVGEKRSRRMRNAAIAAVYEYLSG